MRSVPQFIQQKQIEHFKQADPEYGARVEGALAALVAGDPRQVPIVK